MTKDLFQQLKHLGLDDRIQIQEEQRNPISGRKGCWLAHQKAAQSGIDQGCRRMLVLEEDVYFNKDIFNGFEILNNFFDNIENNANKKQKQTIENQIDTVTNKEMEIGMRMKLDLEQEINKMEREMKKDIDDFDLLFLGHIPGALSLPLPFTLESNHLGLTNSNINNDNFEIIQSEMPLLTHAYVIRYS